jgi:hypothetical protein
MGNGGKAPHIPYLGTRWRGMVSFMPWLNYPQEKTWYTFDRRMSGPQNRPGDCGKRKILPYWKLNPSSSP